METTRASNNMTRSRVPYPWLSTLGALLVIVWQFLLSTPELILPYQLPEYLARQEAVLAGAAIVVLMIYFDISRYLKSWAGYKAQLVAHEKQIAELFDSKRELGSRVRTYSDHADKLKLFISDKLLEYIEYDEKFLHFKNIASEVRHNGVISYDKAQTALKRAVQINLQSTNDSAYNNEFEEASESLLYLWDLLDIATTDNITLHVANRIYDSEEYYFQSMLNKSESTDFPFKPTFSMFAALQKALLPIVDTPDELRRININHCPVDYLEPRFHLHLASDCEMLGNRNHMVLLLENLLNNAVYYSEHRSTSNRYNRVTILLTKERDQVVAEVYNRGPTIKDEDRSRIFQLGYSSRRVRDHHGKGLGLYFVNEICKGFEGSVDFENIENQENSFSIRIEQTNGEVETHFISMTEDNGKPFCQITQNDDAPSRSLEWSYSSQVASVEISSRNNTEPQIINELEGQDSFSHLDNSEPLLPRWVLEITNRKRSAKMVFKPLDVRGVRFRAKIPTALSRLENQETEAEA